MSWGEAIRLLKLLRNDTSSQFATSCEGWTFPIERAALAVLDLYDLLHFVNSDPKKGRPDPHDGRPWKIESPREVTRHGNAAGRSRDEVVEILGNMRRGTISI